jgi:predicted alpha/beta hydrolase
VHPRASQREGFGRTIPAMNVTAAPTTDAATTLALRAADGRELAADLHAPRGTPVAAAVILPGTAIPRRFYRPLAAHLVEAGIAVLTFDYRGIGGSARGPLRTEPATMRDWGQLDIDAALRWLEGRYPQLPRTAIAHSFGGQALGLAPSARGAVDRAILIAAQSGFLGHWPLPIRLRNAAVFGALLPAAAATIGYWPKNLGLGDGLPGGVAREWARWCRAPGYLTAHVPEHERFHGALTIPIRAYAIADDDYAPPAAVDALLSWYARARIEKRTLSPDALGVPVIGHFGPFRASVARTVWPELATFVREGS